MSTVISKEDLDDRLAVEFDDDAEWRAYQFRVARILKKRNGGIALTKEEGHVLADYKTACALKERPLHFHTQEPLPPILYGYNEAVEAFGISKDTLWSLRSQGSNAFTGNLILTASLAASIRDNPNPTTTPINQVFTGNKGKLTPDLQESIIKCLRFAPVLSVVAKAHGLDPKTLINWRERGERGERRYVEFFRQSQAAIGSAQVGALQNIAANESWQAQVKILEFTDPERFGKKTSLEMTGKDGGPIKTDAPPPMTIILQGLANHSYQADPTQATDSPEDE